MHDFKHHRATDTEGAISALNNADDGKYLAGGQTLIPVMKQGLATPSDMIDLGGIVQRADGAFSVAGAKAMRG